MSKIARQIVQLLLGHDLIRFGFTTDENGKEVHYSSKALSLVEKVLENRTIKKSELEQLKLQANSADCYQELWEEASDRANEKSADLEMWKGWTWQAEQEIHDLKEQRERTNRDFCNLINGRDKEIKHLEGESNLIASWFVDKKFELEELKKKYIELLAIDVVHIVNELNRVPEELNPPACLKPKDAVNWNNLHWQGDPPGAFGWKSCEPLESAVLPVKKANFVSNIKKHFSRIAISLLLVTLFALGYVTYKQNQVIVYQQQVLREAYVYVLQNCPPVAPQNQSLERTQNEPLNNPEQHR